MAGPITDRMYDLEKERALQNAIKRKMLESLEASGVTKAGKSFLLLVRHKANQLTVSVCRSTCSTFISCMPNDIL